MEGQQGGGDGAVDDVARDIERFQLSGEGSYQPQRGSASDASHAAPPTGVELQRRIFAHNKPHSSGGLQWVDEVELKKQRRFVIEHPQSKASLIHFISFHSISIPFFPLHSVAVDVLKQLGQNILEGKDLTKIALPGSTFASFSF